MLANNLAKILFAMICDHSAAAAFNHKTSTDNIKDQLKEALGMLASLLDQGFDAQLQKKLADLAKLASRMKPSDPNVQKQEEGPAKAGEQELKEPALTLEELKVINDFLRENFGKDLPEVISLEKYKRRKGQITIEQGDIKPHPSSAAGDTCEDCGNGKVYSTNDPQQQMFIHYKPGKLSKLILRQERLRCNCCKAYVYNKPLSLPGAIGNKTPEFVAHVINNTVNGIPNNRLETLLQGQGIDCSRQSINRCVLEAGQALVPIYNALMRRIGNCPVISTDSTKFDIIEVRSFKEDPNYKAGSKKDPADRASSRASVVVGLDENRKFIGAVYSVSQLHCGEFAEQVLRYRTNPAQPILIADMSTASDTPSYKQALRAELKTHTKAFDLNTLDLTKLPYLRVGCNDHLMVDLKNTAKNYPRLYQLVKLLRKIYSLDRTVAQMGSFERLRLHQEFSTVLYAEIYSIAMSFKEGLNGHIKAEPNSSEGQVLAYLLRHFGPLTHFMHYPGIPISNIVSEHALKKFILIRKNSWTLRTLDSANQWAITSSIAYTAHMLGLNVEFYLADLLKNQKRWVDDPTSWDPFGYIDKKTRAGPMPLSHINKLYKGPWVA